MQKAPYLILIILSFISSSCFSQKKNYTAYEIKSIDVFNDFTNHLNKCIKNKSGITDTLELKYIVSHYLFLNSKLDTVKQNDVDINNLPGEKLDHLRRELNSFYQYLQERENISLAENLAVIPGRLSPDDSIFKQLTSFQKENTFVFFDKRSPEKILGYILFMPPTKNLITTPKIWSWTLLFKFGKFVFRSVTGEEGYEYIFSSGGN